MRIKTFYKDVNGYYRVFYTDTGHVLAWVNSRKEARLMVQS